MIDFDDVTKGNTKEHKPNDPQISDHSYTILVIWENESGKNKCII